MAGKGLTHHCLDPFGKRIPEIAKDVILDNLYEMLVNHRSLGCDQSAVRQSQVIQDSHSGFQLVHGNLLDLSFALGIILDLPQSLFLFRLHLLDHRIQMLIL